MEFVASREIEFVIDYSIGEKIEKIKFCKLEITSQQVLIGEHVFENSKLRSRKARIRFLFQDRLEFIVRITTDSIEEQKFRITKDTKRVEINLNLDLSQRGFEYLRDFTVKKILFPNSSVSLTRMYKPKIGHQPIYRIINTGSQRYYGQSATRHFYGKLQILHDQRDWIHHIIGSYCHSTVPEKILSKGDTVYSYIASYSYRDEYRFKSSGRYKYSVLLGLAPYSRGIPSRLYQEAITRSRILELVEMEDEFEIGERN